MSRLWLLVIGIASLAVFPPAHAEILTSFRELQAQSVSGPTERWTQEFGTWPVILSFAEVQAMRDRAYMFCTKRHDGAKQCNIEQDRSLRTAIDALGAFQFYESQDRSALRGRAFSIKINPHFFLEAKRYCFELYTDHGSKDARMLGPCMAVAIGSDFFATGPIVD